MTISKVGAVAIDLNILKMVDINIIFCSEVTMKGLKPNHT